MFISSELYTGKYPQLSIPPPGRDFTRCHLGGRILKWEQEKKIKKCETKRKKMKHKCKKLKCKGQKESQKSRGSWGTEDGVSWAGGKISFLEAPLTPPPPEEKKLNLRGFLTDVYSRPLSYLGGSPGPWEGWTVQTPASIHSPPIGREATRL